MDRDNFTFFFFTTKRIVRSTFQSSFICLFHYHYTAYTPTPTPTPTPTLSTSSWAETNQTLRQLPLWSHRKECKVNCALVCGAFNKPPAEGIRNSILLKLHPDMRLEISAQDFPTRLQVTPDETAKERTVL
jgi:hypothetical protein